MKLIPLTKGYFSKVDDEDYERLSQFKWQALVDKKMKYIVYARRTTRKSECLKSTVLMHHEVFGSDEHRIDHIDRDTLNNQKANLRAATPVQNGMNMKLKVHSTPYKGVTFFRPTSRYKVCIKHEKKYKYLGLYDSPVDAALVYDYHANLYYGEFALTNRKMGLI